MKRKITFVQIFLMALMIALCCFALFGCGPNEPPIPEVKNVALTAVDGTSLGKVGARHKLTYTAPEGSEISVSVMLGASSATVGDYSRMDEEFVFYTAGEYTVTVYAAKDGMVGSADTKLTVRAGEISVSNVSVAAAAGEAYGKVGALHVLSYTTEAGSEVEVKIEKDGSPATDAVFDSRYNTIIFGSAGKYTVTVTATAGEKSDSAATEIEISEVETTPTVALALDKSTVKEDEEITLTATVTYVSGDARGEERVNVLYRAKTTGSFSEAKEGTYTLNGVRFIPHTAGEWKLVYKAESRGGAVAEANATLLCTPAEITLSLKTNDRHRIQTLRETDIDYLVEGAAEKYDVTYKLQGTNRVETSKGNGNSVRVKALDVDYFTLTVVYTHKVDKTIHKEIDIDVYSVDNLTYSPVWGEDPFGGMPTDVLTSMGHLLYFDATTSGGNKRILTGKDAKYEVIQSNITTTRNGGADVQVLYGAGEDENYPYVIVTDFDTNVATGNFTLKMTLTDPYTGYSAVATKQFNVLPTTNDNSNAAKFIQNYVKEHSDFFHMGSMDYTNLCSDCRHNMILTKTGTIMQRSNPYWDLNGGNADFAQMDFATAASNCRLEFKFTVLSPNQTSGELWLGIGMRTVNTGSGWAGFFDLHLVDGRLDITNGLSQKPTMESTSDIANKPLGLNNTTLFVRIDRSVVNNKVEYIVSAKTEEDGAYQQYYRCTYNSSTSAGNAGAPIKQYQFTHRYGGGCYAVENVSIATI